MIYDLLIIGGGPAGLSVAKKAYETGIKNMLVLERDDELGGILNQCIHNGFGIEKFNKELTGPEYASLYIEDIEEKGINYLLGSMVLNIRDEGEYKVVEVASKEKGYLELKTKTVVLAMGSRERTRMMIQTPGTRPAGVFNAGLAQKYVNIDGYMVGKKVVILGSGDIGLIMARRMTLVGAEVLRVVEIEPYSNGLSRNVMQCLKDFDIPLQLSHTITEIKGNDRVESVVIAEVDENKNVIESTKEEVECDTVLFSVGLIPENELSTNLGVEIDNRTQGPKVNEKLETNIPGVFACGNVLHIHDVVDYVSDEAEQAADQVHKYLTDTQDICKRQIVLENSDDISYIVPQTIECKHSDIELKFRVRKPASNVRIILEDSEGNVLVNRKKWAVSPSEMEKVMIKGKMLEDIKGNLTLRLKAEE
ncbi:MAG: FAD-dependent oxidoreductase [Clostridiales bacterium]|nr:FAD-dependent oxidoreductase [Clostridiales bacterium]